MADFGTALQWLKEGKKVRRPMWDNPRYSYLQEEDVFQTNAWNGSSQVTTWPTQAVMATDWEIYEEPSRWNKGDTAYIRVRIGQPCTDRTILCYTGKSLPLHVREDELITEDEVRKMSR